jgi:hypothetical protein
LSFSKNFEEWIENYRQLPPENRLDLAVADLARYYTSSGAGNEIKNYVLDSSLTNLEGLVSRINPSSDKSEEALSLEAQAKLRSILTDTSEGALFITDIMTKIRDNLGDYDKIDQLIQIRFESSAVPDSPVNATANIDDGVGVKQQCGILRNVLLDISRKKSLEGTGQSLEEVTPSDGNDGGAPADRIDNPWLTVVNVNDNRLTPANRRSDAGSIFFNSIPTIEMSQCAPFIKLMFVSETDTFSNGSKAMTLYGYAAGSPDESITPTSFNESKGVNLNSLSPVGESDNEFDLSGGTFTGNISELFDDVTSTDIEVEVAQTSNAGIELFQAPQTLNNLGNGGNADAGGVINPSAPLASLERLTVDIVGLGLATLANKTASMELILHDRSRLPLIAPIVGASSFAGTYVVIEYGWMHPQASGNIVGNVYADFLNSLRSKSAFNIQVADLTMLEDGQVRVSLRLASRGVGDMASIPAAVGVTHVPASMIAPFLNRIIDVISKSRTDYWKNRISSGLDNGDLEDEDVISHLQVTRDILMDVQGGFTAVGGFQSPVAMIEIDKYRQLLRLLRNDQGAEALESGAEILKELVALIDDQNNSSDKYSTLRTMMISKLLNLSKVDIFNDGQWYYPIQKLITEKENRGEPIGLSGSENAETNIGSLWPSLGSVLLTYVGRPLQATGRYDEVQFHFYPFNNHASYMANKNISTFNLIGFTEFLMKVAQERPGISTSAFAEMLFKDSCGPENQSHPMYGLTEIYKEISSEALKGKTPEERKSAIIANQGARADALREIYRDHVKDGLNRMDKFEIPDITMLTECLPAKVTGDGGGIFNTKTILRIHVFDAKAGIPYEAELLNQVMRQGEAAIEVITQDIEAQSDNGKAEQAAAESASSAALSAMVDSFIEDGKIVKSEEVIVESRDADGGSTAEQMYISAMPARDIKQAIKSVYPSITFGTQFTNVFSVGMSSNTGGAVNQVLLLNAIDDSSQGSQTSQSSTSVEDVFVIPTNASLQTAGFPMVTYGQKYFLDMGTGTTADNFYYVIGIRHTLGPGIFESTFNMTYNGSATIKSMRNALDIASKAEFSTT